MACLTLINATHFHYNLTLGPHIIYISFFQTLHYMVGLGTLYRKLHVFMMGMERKNSEKTTGNGKKRKEHFPKLSVKS